MGKQMKKRLKEAARQGYSCEDIDSYGKESLGFAAISSALALELGALGLVFRYDPYATVNFSALLIMAAIFGFIPMVISDRCHYKEPKAKNSTERIKKLRIIMIWCSLSVLASIITVMLLVALRFTSVECYCHPALLFGLCVYLYVLLACASVIVWAAGKSFSKKSYVRGWSHSQQ